MSNETTSTQTIVLGGGCFWCLDAAYRRIEGVIEVVSGYAGGHVPNPSYERVASQTTGHAEVVQITFDPKVITLEDIFEIFFVIHDPTTKDRQGNDVGPEYRSIVLYEGDEQKAVAEQSLAKAADHWSDPIVTEIVPLEAFYKAEDYHQDYFNKNPNAGYCQVIINPKLAKLRQKFAERLKKDVA